MKKIQQGFTLIELMIVVAIIGILAAVAIPAYQDYVVKAKLSKVTSTMDSVKLALAMYLQEQGSFPVSARLTVASPGGVAVSNPPVTGVDDVWASIGFGKTPALPPEVKTMYYETNATGSNMALTLVMTNIRAKTIDGLAVAITPVISGTNVGSGLTLPTAPGAGESALGGTALNWHYGCAAGLDVVAQKFFGNCS